MKFISLKPARNNIHKYVAIVEDNEGKQHTIRFGQFGASDFTRHRNEIRKNRYLDRHRERENWDDILTSGAWSRWLLWNEPTIAESLADIRKRFFS